MALQYKIFSKISSRTAKILAMVTDEKASCEVIKSPEQCFANISTTALSDDEIIACAADLENALLSQVADERNFDDLYKKKTRHVMKLRVPPKTILWWLNLKKI